MASTTYPYAIFIPLILASHGLRKGSLSRSGAIAAFLVGYGHMANPLRLFGVSLIFFYLAGSRATKIKADIKARLEDGPDPSKPGGNRNAIQVLSNALPSLCAALAFRFLTPPQLRSAIDDPLDDAFGKPLIYVALAQLSCNFADTLASELGILSASRPVYILTLKPVPPGTNGGVSILGFMWSAVGGLLIGLVMVISLLVERPATRASLGWAVEMLVFATVCGLAGSLLDSFMGATLQQTLYSTVDKRILTDHSARANDERGLQKIGVGRDILSNSAVNFWSGIFMAGVGWQYGQR